MDPSSRRWSRRRWLMIAFAFWATVINYLDRQTLSVAAPVLREQFHMSNVAYSRVLFAFPAGVHDHERRVRAADRPAGHAPRLRAVHGWWSAAALLHAFARGALSLGVFRFLLGMGEAGNWPAASRWWRSGFLSASGPWPRDSSTAAQRWARFWRRPVVACVLLKFGWRSAFVAVGRGGIRLAAVLVADLRAVRPGRRRRRPGHPPGLRQLLRTASFWRSRSRRYSWTRCGTSTFSGFRNT